MLGESRYTTCRHATRGASRALLDGDRTPGDVKSVKLRDKTGMDEVVQQVSKRLGQRESEHGSNLIRQAQTSTQLQSLKEAQARRPFLLL